VSKSAQIIVLDAGGQYCHLIARRIRDLGVYTEIRRLDCDPDELKNTKGIVLSGGPQSVYESNAIMVNPKIFTCNVPILGICYGQQMIVYLLGGKVSQSRIREYGSADLFVQGEQNIFQGLRKKERVWMSHGDAVDILPEGFSIIGYTADCPIAAIANFSQKIYGLQFHPEVVHTVSGIRILRNFIFSICGCKQDWNPGENVKIIEEKIKEQTNGRNVFFLISGGVDSSVAFTLCTRALGRERVRGLYVDTGFMRKNETKIVEQAFKEVGVDNVDVVDAQSIFFAQLEHVIDPEEKRKIIGDLFINIQEKKLNEITTGNDDWVLGQGTIYPDTIESGGSKFSALIKTHHNRVTRIQEMIGEGKIIEPLSEYYKDEVRELGRSIRLPESIVGREPFPGPGLAVRCLCSIKHKSLEFTQHSQEIARKYKVQSWIVPIETVGVQGDGRSYARLMVVSGNVCWGTLNEISVEVTNSLPEINRVAYLVASKDFFPKFNVHPARLTKDRIQLLQEANDLVYQFVSEEQFKEIWQFPVILVPLGARNDGETVALRPVRSVDGMTAEFAQIERSTLKILGKKLLELDGVDSVIYDITHKPPGTIEWE